MEIIIYNPIEVSFTHYPSGDKITCVHTGGRRRSKDWMKDRTDFFSRYRSVNIHYCVAPEEVSIDNRMGNGQTEIIMLASGGKGLEDLFVPPQKNKVSK